MLHAGSPCSASAQWRGLHRCVQAKGHVSSVCWSRMGTPLKAGALMQQGRLPCGSMRGAVLRACQTEVSGDRRAAGNLARHTHPTYCAAAHALLCPHGASPRCHLSRYHCTWRTSMLQLFGALPLTQAGPWISASTPHTFEATGLCCQLRRNAIIGRRSWKPPRTQLARRMRSRVLLV